MNIKNGFFQELDFLLNSDSGPPSRLDVEEKRVHATPPASPVTLPYGLASPTSPGGLLRMGNAHSDLEADKAELERLVKTGKELAVERLTTFLQVSIFILLIVFF